MISKNYGFSMTLFMKGVLLEDLHNEQRKRRRMKSGDMIIDQ